MSGATSSRFAALLLAALLSGCALIRQGTSQEVEFSSEPAGASFSVNGRTEKTPATVKLPKADYDIVFSMPGYHDEPVPLRRKTCAYFYWSIPIGLIAAVIDIVSGAWQEFERTKIHAILRQRVDVGEEIVVRFTSEPPGAEILMGGAILGKTPGEVKVLWFPTETEKEATLRLADYLRYTVRFAKDRREVPVTLAPAPVTVEFRSVPADAEIWLEGRFVGRTPLPIDVPWKAGEIAKAVELRKAEYDTLKLQLGRTARALEGTLRETEVPITLPLKVQPAGASIEIDGQAVAPKPGGGLELLWTRSRRITTLKVSHPGYQTQTIEVTREKADKALDVRLVPALP